MGFGVTVHSACTMICGLGDMVHDVEQGGNAGLNLWEEMVRKDATVWVNSCVPLKDRKQTMIRGPKLSILGLGYNKTS